MKKLRLNFIPWIQSLNSIVAVLLRAVLPANGNGVIA